jgi:hypothetical protein
VRIESQPRGAGLQQPNPSPRLGDELEEVSRER